MRERIVCPDCEKVFYEDIEDARTELTCPLCSHAFVHISNGAFIDYEEETLHMPLNDTPRKPAPDPKPIVIDGDPKPGMIFGNYEIIEEIARGATGIVYKARQCKLDRVVALKVLLAGETASEEQIKRFHSEAKAVAKLRHPNIVPVYDVDVYKGKHFFAMEYVDGLPLHKAMKQKRLTPNEALDIIVKVAEAIAAAHEAHIIHRDIKPANIMIDKTGRVQVMDFGLAKQIEADTQYTRSGTTMGTPNYMPIEQAQGDVKNINERSDIYSLGAVLYEMLTGVPPYIAETNLKTILKVINEDPIPPRRRNPYIHSDIETICMKAMTKESERRYETVRVFIDDIKRFQAGEPILARPASTAYRLSKSLRKHRSIIVTSLLTIVFSLIVVIAILPLLIGPGPTPIVDPNDKEEPNNRDRPGKLVKIYKDPWRAVGDKDDIGDFIKNAAVSEQYLPAFTDIKRLPGMRLPGDIRVDLKVKVNQTKGESAKIGCYLYGRKEADSKSEYLHGYAFKFYFDDGVLNRIEFLRGDEPRGSGWPNLSFRPVDGVVRCAITINQAHTVTPEINGEKLSTYQIKEVDLVGEQRLPGFGLMMYGTGLSFSNDDFVISEIIPPADEMLLAAYKEYNEGRFVEAEALYEKFRKIYGPEVGKPLEQGGITREELIASRMGIAKSLARQTGVLDGGQDETNPRVIGIVKMFEQIADDCEEEQNNKRLREDAVEALLWRARLILTTDGKASLFTLANEIAALSGESAVKCGSDILNGLPLSFADGILAGVKDADAGFAADVCETLAERIADNISDYVRLTLRAADLYQRMGGWPNALDRYNAIAALAQKHHDNLDLKKADISARVMIARHFYDQNGDLAAFAERMKEIWDIARMSVDPDEPESYLFQCDLADAGLWLASMRVGEWKRTGTEKDNFLLNAREEIDQIVRFVEPDDKAPDGDHNHWVMVNGEAIRLLMNIYKIRSETFSYSVNDILGVSRGFINNRRIPAQACAEMELFNGEVLLYFRKYSQARDLFSRFIEPDLPYFRAVDLIIESLISEGYSHKKDAAEIDLINALMVKYGEFVKVDYGQIEEVGEIKQSLRSKIILTALLQIIDDPVRETDPAYAQYRINLYKNLLEAIDGDLSDNETACVVTAMGDVGEEGIEQLMKAKLGVRPDMSDNLFVDDLDMVRNQKSEARKNEMIFWLGVRLLFESRAEKDDTPQDKNKKEKMAAKAREYFREVLRRDVFCDYWYSRFLHVMLREKPVEISSI